MLTYRWLPVALLFASSTSSALPPNAAPGLRPGANHHTGDDGFVADLGREPEPGEEKLRMHEHFVAVRARLAARPATKPELEAKRQQLLAALDTYIAHDITPDNDALPWRTPVFIDGKGTICAVGYLIQESAGRPLAEKIAASHRYSFIEDIAKDMPEVRDWVAASGFTLDELGQIQPGYMGPDVLQYHPFALAKDTDTLDGAYASNGMTGTIRGRKMEGAWVLRDDQGVVHGSGELHRGAGTWTSFYASGAKMAEGAYARNRPSGRWRFFFDSGHLAAEGSFRAGVRTGDWRFYYDDAATTPIAIGAFDQTGRVDGTWKHFDAKGALLATSAADVVPASWHVEHQLFWSAAYRIDIAPSGDGITHRIHEGTISGDDHRLDELATADGRERVYLRYDTSDMFDASGHKLVQVAGGWRADDCKWNAARKRAARAGDLAQLHGLIWNETDQLCAAGALVPRARAARLTQLAGSMTAVRAASPELLQELALDDKTPTDLTSVLAANMALDIEWPHVDGRFVQVFKTLPGYTHI